MFFAQQALPEDMGRREDEVTPALRDAEVEPPFRRHPVNILGPRPLWKWPWARGG
jgi:hypothetical protein